MDKFHREKKRQQEVKPLVAGPSKFQNLFSVKRVVDMMKKNYNEYVKRSSYKRVVVASSMLLALMLMQLKMNRR